MVAFTRSRSLTGSIPVAGGLLAGLAVVATVTLIPAATLEAWVWSSGVAALLPAAEPPLGVTARAVLALVGGSMAAAVAWSALYLLFGPGGYLNREGEAAPAVRRADAHPDAPPREPMTAADLGTPLMEVGAAPAKPVSIVEAVIPRERTVPANLDERLASFDPDALLTPVAELARPERKLAAAPALAPGERIETFELTPLIRSAPEVSSEPRPATSVADLLARLEEGARRRTARG